eukprot:3431561-Rhodomonas_salina.1
MLGSADQRPERIGTRRRNLRHNATKPDVSCYRWQLPGTCQAATTTLEIPMPLAAPHAVGFKRRRRLPLRRAPLRKQRDPSDLSSRDFGS